MYPSNEPNDLEEKEYQSQGIAALNNFREGAEKARKIMLSEAGKLDIVHNRCLEKEKMMGDILSEFQRKTRIFSELMDVIMKKTLNTTSKIETNITLLDFIEDMLRALTKEKINQSNVYQNIRDIIRNIDIDNKLKAPLMKTFNTFRNEKTKESKEQFIREIQKIKLNIENEVDIGESDLYNQKEKEKQELKKKLENQESISNKQKETIDELRTKNTEKEKEAERLRKEAEERGQTNQDNVVNDEDRGDSNENNMNEDV